MKKEIIDACNSFNQLVNCIMDMTFLIKRIDENNCTDETYKNLLNAFIDFEYKFIELYESYKKADMAEDKC